jgi:hypothetical protein
VLNQLSTTPRRRMGSGCIGPHFLNLGSSWRWVVSFTPLPLYPQGKNTRSSLNKRIAGLQSRCGRRGENSWPYRESNSDPSVVQPIVNRYPDYAIPGSHRVYVRCYNLLTQLSPSWEAASCAATQELSRILWNPKVHYCVHKSPPLVPILSHIIPICTIPFYLCKTPFNIVHPTTSSSSQWSLSFKLSHQYPICIPHLPHSFYMPCLCYLPWIVHYIYTWRTVQVMKLVIALLYLDINFYICTVQHETHGTSLKSTQCCYADMRMNFRNRRSAIL